MLSLQFPDFRAIILHPLYFVQTLFRLEMVKPFPAREDF